MADLLEDIEIEIACRGCGRKTDKNVGWIRNHEQFVCSCGVAVDAIWIQQAIAKSEREWADLLDTLTLFSSPAQFPDEFRRTPRRP